MDSRKNSDRSRKDSNQSSGRSSDNVHLEFLLGSVHRKSQKRRGGEKFPVKSSLPASREGTIAHYSPGSRERWNFAREAISRGFCFAVN